MTSIPHTSSIHSSDIHTSTSGIPGSTLKIIAMISMLIDHATVVLLRPFALTNHHLATLYTFLRSIGRIAFPIFCFLLIQGFCNTRNKVKYCCNMLLFALISEIPFDWALKSTWFQPKFQNVLFTLLIGLLCMCALAYIDKKQYPNVVRILLSVCSVGAACVVARLVHCNYGYWGVLCIVIMYLYRTEKQTCYLLGCGVLTIFDPSELFALLGLMPVLRYNGDRGLRLKYIFYLFYPVHLLVLKAIAYLLL